MADKILVTYASRAGSTAEIAEAIGRELEEHDLSVDVIDCREVTDLSPYRAVVIGSPVYMGKLLPEIAKCVQKHASAFAAMPTAGFVVGMPLAEPTPENMQRARALLSDAVKPAEIRDFGLFAGRLERSNLSFWQRTLSELMKAKFGDFRDPEAIRRWARGLPDSLHLSGD
jgi:menaquinone-dependent protoporphyrinogen oxidase